MAFSSTYRLRNPPGDKAWSDQTSRALLHDITGVLQRAEEIAGEGTTGTETQADPPLSEAEFLPVLAKAILCRGIHQYDESVTIPAGAILAHTLQSQRNKHFPAVIKVELSDTGNSGLPTVSRSSAPVTANSCFTPLPQQEFTARSQDRFWQMLQLNRKRKRSGGGSGGGEVASRTAGHRILSSFYAHYKATNNGKGPNSGQLREFVRSDSAKSEFINMEHFYESEAKLREACKNLCKTMKREGDEETVGYLWHPKEGGTTSVEEEQICCEIREAVESDDLMAIGAAAEKGMTKDLFEKLVTIRRKHQDWRGLTAGETADVSAFHSWYQQNK